MRTAAAIVAAFVAGAAAAPQAVTSPIAPAEKAPEGCKPDFQGTFQISTQTLGNSKRDLRIRQSVPLETKLQGGVLTDAKGRIGYIASNNQFQFDGPPQAGAKLTAGWTVCPNSSIALGDSTVFYQCLSGTFYNLYDEKTAEQCSPVHLQAITPNGAPAAPVQAAGDGQITGGPAAAPRPVCQIGDGQLQNNNCTPPIAQIPDGQIQAPKPIAQIPDGQVQAPKPIAQIPDGQVQAPGNTTTPSRPGNGNGTIIPFQGDAAAPVFRTELLGLALGVLALATL